MPGSVVVVNVVVVDTSRLRGVRDLVFDLRVYG